MPTGTKKKQGKQYDSLETSKLNELERQILIKTNALWLPQPGPQTEAYNSPVDELYYGGSAGGGKTDLVLGLALTQHQKSIIFRRRYPDLREIEQRSEQMLPIETGARFNHNDHIWRGIPGGRTLEFGALEHLKDKGKFQGRAHDLKAWDELPQFLEDQYIFVNAWNRSTDPNQRCRVVAEGNPPTSSEGEWVIQRWGAWLDPGHSNPAKPGELRWYVREDGKEIEVEGPAPIKHKDEVLIPKSRTFIPAFLADNLYLTYDDSYRSTLQQLPEPLRSILLHGDFSAVGEDDPWQIFPTAWVKQAMERWVPAMDMQTGQGCDVSRGGKDQTIIAKKHNTRIDNLIKYPGELVKSGAIVANWNIKACDRPDVPIGIDMTGGWGTSPYDKLVEDGRYSVVPVNFSSAAQDINGNPVTDKTGALKFRNLRTWMAWELREAIDPDGEDPIGLPNDSQLLGDMCAIHWKVVPGGIAAESKGDIVKRIQRSTDCLDAVMIANYVSKHTFTSRDIEMILSLNKGLSADGGRRDTAGLVTGKMVW